MIDPPPAGTGIRTRNLVVESRVPDHWAIPAMAGAKKMTLGPVDLFVKKHYQIPWFWDFGKAKFGINTCIRNCRKNPISSW